MAHQPSAVEPRLSAVDVPTNVAWPRREHARSGNNLSITSNGKIKLVELLTISTTTYNAFQAPSPTEISPRYYHPTPPASLALSLFFPPSRLCKIHTLTPMLSYTSEELPTRPPQPTAGRSRRSSPWLYLRQDRPSRIMAYRLRDAPPPGTYNSQLPHRGSRILFAAFEIRCSHRGSVQCEVTESQRKVGARRSSSKIKAGSRTGQGASNARIKRLGHDDKKVCNGG